MRSLSCDLHLSTPYLLGFAIALVLGTTYEISYFPAMCDELRVFNMGAFSVGQIAAFLAVAFLSRRRSLTPKAIFSWWTIAVGVAGLAITQFGLQRIGLIAWTLTGLGSFLWGAHRALLVLLWLELFTFVKERDLIVFLSLSHLLSAALSFLLSFLDSYLVVGAVLAVLAPASYAAYVKSSIRFANYHLPKGSTPSGWSFPYRPVIFISVFMFVNEFVRSFLPSDVAVYVIAGPIAASLPLALLAIFAFDRVSLGGLYRISLPLLLGGVLCSFPVGAEFLAAFLTNAAYALFEVFTTTLLCLIARRYSVDPFWLFGITEAASDLAGVLGEMPSAAGVGISDFNAHAGSVIALLVPALVYVFMTFLSSSDMSGAWGVRRETDDEGGAYLASGVCRDEEVCAKIARQFALTRREEEVFALLARRKTVPEIESELFISGTTAKTHVQHIYKKLDIHNRQELQDLFRSFLEERRS